MSAAPPREAAEDKPFSVYLFGRYFAILSVLPYFLLVIVLFFVASFFLAMILAGGALESFKLVLMPFMLGGALTAPFLAIFLIMIRWHGKRRLDVDANGVTMVMPNGSSVYVPWEFLAAVELRFTKPKMVHCTLISPRIRFSFSNLEFNLEQRQPINQLFPKAFDLDKTRGFLYYLHRKAPHLSWRLTEAFRERFKVHYPPYDLEKMR